MFASLDWCGCIVSGHLPTANPELSICSPWRQLFGGRLLHLLYPRGKGVRVPGETDLHKTLKKEACRWLFRMGYRCIAAEVRLKPLGIIDAVGSGIFRPFHNYLAVPIELPQVCFVECKASRADFLRDHSNDG